MKFPNGGTTGELNGRISLRNEKKRDARQRHPFNVFEEVMKTKISVPCGTVILFNGVKVYGEPKPHYRWWFDAKEFNIALD